MEKRCPAPRNSRAEHIRACARISSAMHAKYMPSSYSVAPIEEHASGLWGTGSFWLSADRTGLDRIGLYPEINGRHISVVGRYISVHCININMRISRSEPSAKTQEGSRKTSSSTHYLNKPWRARSRASLLAHDSWHHGIVASFAIAVIADNFSR